VDVVSSLFAFQLDVALCLMNPTDYQGRRGNGPSRRLACHYILEPDGGSTIKEADDSAIGQWNEAEVYRRPAAVRLRSRGPRVMLTASRVRSGAWAIVRHERQPSGVECLHE
jgi:hypothetical protein